MPLRFQKRLRILPWVRINLSKSGLSTSLGPRGADVNIGKDGITTNAGIPGTGLSWRSKLGGKGAGLGMLLLAALGYWGFSHFVRIEKPAAPPSAPSPKVAEPALANTGYAGQAPVTTARQAPRKAAEAAIPGLRYVRRGGSVLRAQAKASAKTLKKEVKGAVVTVKAIDADGWARVTDGNISGYMRASVLGMDKPE